MRKKFEGEKPENKAVEEERQKKLTGSVSTGSVGELNNAG